MEKVYLITGKNKVKEWAVKVFLFEETAKSYLDECEKFADFLNSPESVPEDLEFLKIVDPQAEFDGEIKYKIEEMGAE